MEMPLLHSSPGTCSPAHLIDPLGNGVDLQHLVAVVVDDLHSTFPPRRGGERDAPDRIQPRPFGLVDLGAEGSPSSGAARGRSSSCGPPRPASCPSGTRVSCAWSSGAVLAARVAVCPSPSVPGWLS